MQTGHLIFLFFFFFLIELFYHKIADHFNIIDKPNRRSSHEAVTIRGGGVLFSIAGLVFFVLNDFQYPHFITGLLLIAFISFMDDILTLKNKVRVVVHFVSVTLLLWEWHLFSIPVFLLIAVVIAVIGAINAYNFMDGINGITGLYSLVTLGTLLFINESVLEFAPNEFFIYIILSVLVFNFFNFRKKAKCFAGDVGSISIAYIILFLIGRLIIQTHNFSYILFLLVYGLDAVVTIFFRLIRRENVFQAHRSHFYQYLANEKGISHLYISTGYAMLQLLINVIVIGLAIRSLSFTIGAVLLSVCLFVCLRFFTEGKVRLLKKTVH